MTTSFRCYFNSLPESYLSGFKNAYALRRWRSWHPLRCTFFILCFRYHIQFASSFNLNNNIFQVDTESFTDLTTIFISHLNWSPIFYKFRLRPEWWEEVGLFVTNISQCKKSQKANIQLSNNIFTNLPLQFSFTVPNPAKTF